MSLRARLSGVRLVFLQRFVEELMHWITGLLSMGAPPLELPPWVTEQKSAAEADGRNAAQPGQQQQQLSQSTPAYVTPTGQVWSYSTLHTYGTGVEPQWGWLCGVH